jgi:hypothetical protein
MLQDDTLSAAVMDAQGNELPLRQTRRFIIKVKSEGDLD